MITFTEAYGTFADTGESRGDRDAYHKALVEFAGNTAVGTAYRESGDGLPAHYDESATGQGQFPFGD